MPLAWGSGMSTPQDVLGTNAAFYAVFADGDVTMMERLWASASEVSCLHPGWPPVFGRDQVLDSWRLILEQPPPIVAGDPRVMQFGDTAVVVCQERVGGMMLAATNIFVREDGVWKLVHRQATRLPELVPPRWAMH